PTRCCGRSIPARRRWKAAPCSSAGAIFMPCVPCSAWRRRRCSLGRRSVERAVELATGKGRCSGLPSRHGAGMMKGKPALAALAAIITGGASVCAEAKDAAAAGEGLSSFLRLLTERIDVTFSRIPEVWTFLGGLVHRFDLREALLLVGIF